VRRNVRTVSQRRRQPFSAGRLRVTLRTADGLQDVTNVAMAFDTREGWIERLDGPPYIVVGGSLRRVREHGVVRVERRR